MGSLLRYEGSLEGSGRSRHPVLNLGDARMTSETAAQFCEVQRPRGQKGGRRAMTVRFGTQDGVPSP